GRAMVLAQSEQPAGGRCPVAQPARRLRQLLLPRPGVACAGARAVGRLYTFDVAPGSGVPAAGHAGRAAADGDRAADGAAVPHAGGWVADPAAAFDAECAADARAADQP